MLVLTRRVGEAIVIGDSVSIKVLQNRGGRIQLGIEAPNEVPVLRQELHARKADSETPAKEGISQRA